ncbi:MAG: hypothetical protein IPM60_04470 [Rhodospirillales bacterium]|nr:hypothetical protein [Rhodospirillales bacterium]
MIRIIGSLALLLTLVAGAVFLAETMSSTETSTTPSRVIAMPTPLPPQTRRELPEDGTEPEPPRDADAVPGDDLAAVETAAGRPSEAGADVSAEADREPHADAAPDERRQAEPAPAGRDDRPPRVADEAEIAPAPGTAPSQEAGTAPSQEAGTAPSQEAGTAPSQEAGTAPSKVSEGEQAEGLELVTDGEAPASPPATAPDSVPEPDHGTRAPRIPPGAVPEPVETTRSSNLRAEPGPDGKILANIPGGSKGVRLHPDPFFGYYRVRVSGQEGWLWYRNVAVARDPEPSAADDADDSGDGASPPARAPVPSSQDRPGPSPDFSP